MKDLSVAKKYIPLDKSWMIRIGVLDLIHGYNDTIDYLKKYREELGDDLKSLFESSLQWLQDKPIDVGESGTLYRFLKFASWKLNKNKKFIRRGTLRDRKIFDKPEIVNWPLNQLLKLDNGTSQCASASVLMGNQEKIANPPYKLQVTYDAVEHWHNARREGKKWEPKFDQTILAQASAYLSWLKNGKINFIPKQAEDYCFARAFGLMTPKEGEKRWPSLRGHESDRIKEVEQALRQEKIISKDHRVIQAVALLKGNKIKIKYPDSVNKSWPQFWEFLNDYK